MNRNLTIGLQMAMVVLQSINLGGAVPAEAQIYVATAITALQGAMAVMAHNYNPDGTNAKVPYVKPKKKSLTLGM